MNTIYEVAIAGFAGMILHMLMKGKDLQDLAKRSNLEFKFSKFFKDDWLSHLISITAVGLYILLVKRRLGSIPDSLYELLLAFSATVGYSGDSLVSRFFSFTNKRINATIDAKTTISDISTGTVNKPTTIIEQEKIKTPTP